MANNMYRVGDYVYFDVLPTSPYSIRRIEELIKNANGVVEAKVLCFFRRRDISNSLISLADKHNIALEEEQELEAESLSEKQKHQLKHRELFFSRQIETLPATHIRDKEDSFFYTLVYEPNQKTLLADRGEIRVGSRYQAEVQQKRPEQPEIDPNKKYETLVFRPNHLTDAEIDQYLTIVKSIGTFGRALDHSSSVKQPNLLITAATASRDVTVQKALDFLHQHDYDIGKALLAFTPNNVPLICKDELDEWSPAEASLFEESIDKYGKTFLEIRKDVLPWKKMKNIVEYYYMWKTTDRYVPQKRHKANENESKLKQVYIPNSATKQQVNGGSGTIPGDVPGKSCESCAKTTSPLWYAYGAAHTNNRLCQDCWTYFKKFGGLRYPNKYFLQEEAAAAAAAAAEAAANDKASPAASNGTTGNGPALENSNSVASSNNSASSTPAAAIVSGKESPSQQANSNSNSSTADVELKCKECSKTFNRQEHLVSHMVTHRSYRCTYCNNKEYRIKAHLVRHVQQAHSNGGRSDSPRQIMKTRPAFLVRPHQLERAARVLLPELVRLKSLSKNPFLSINVTQIKQEMQTKYPKLPELPKLKSTKRGKVVEVAYKLGIDQQACPDWLIALPKNKLPQPERLAFPVGDQSKVSRNNSNGLSTTSRKRTHDQSDSNSCSQSLNRRALVAPEQLSARTNGSTTNGKSRVSVVRTDGKSKLITYDDAPEDILFVRTEATKKLRQQIQATIVKRLRRTPCSKNAEFPSFYDASKLV